MSRIFARTPRVAKVCRSAEICSSRVIDGIALSICECASMQRRGGIDFDVKLCVAARNSFQWTDFCE